MFVLAEVKIRFTDAHDATQSTMIFRQVLQTIVIQIASFDLSSCGCGEPSFASPSYRSAGDLSENPAPHRIAVLLPTRRDIRRVDTIVRVQRLHVFFAEVTRVSGQRGDVFRHVCSIKILNRLINHRHRLTNIVRLIGHVCCDDDLLFVGNRLSIPTLITVL